jgi:hypothetical protein
VAGATIAGLLVFLFWGTSFGPLELLRCLAGLAALWAPVGAVVFLALDGKIDDFLSRLTFSAIASFCLTTLAYFAFCMVDLWVPGFGKAFYAAQAGLLAVAAVWAWRRGLRLGLQRWHAAAAHFDWTLAALVVASLLVTLRYKTAFEWQPEHHRYLMVVDGDFSYFSAIAHELGRHTPPLQQPTRAGVPDRAYHMFPHLTAMLIGRFTGQPDLMRANMVYQFSVLDVLTCLTLFCTAWLLTGSRAAAYITVALMYIGTIPLPRLGTGPAEKYLYFTLWPQASSTVEPVLVTSPQMYPGVVIYYGILLGVALACQRLARGQPVGGLAVVLALMGAALARFRVQIFLPLVPALGLLLAYFWWKTRQRAILAAGCLFVAVCGGLLLETRLGSYLPNTSHLAIGNSHLPMKAGLLITWPGEPWTWEKLSASLCEYPEAFDWTWLILCVSLFTLLNVIGLPLLIGLAGYCRETWAWGEWRLLTLLSLWMVLGSLLGAMFITATYDPWSVGGQMLLHTPWYVFPLAGVGFWALWQRLPVAWTRHRLAWQSVGVALLLATCLWHLFRPPSEVQQDVYEREVVLSEDDWADLDYIRQTLPDDAVVLSSDVLSEKLRFHGQGTAIFSGVAGRRAYLEYIPVGGKLWVDETDSDAGRGKRIIALWGADTEEQFRRLLPPQATHVVEYAQFPLRLHPPGVLKPVWRSPRRLVTVWEVVR